MKTSELYSILNRKERKKEKVLYLIIFLSIVISVSISLVIPCIKYQANDFCEENARLLNGGELKIEAAYEDERWEEYFNSLDKEGYIVSKYRASSVTMEDKGNDIYCSMVSGQYDMGTDEIILSKRLADTKGTRVGDTVTLAGRDYTVKEIEENMKGVDAQSELIGYCKTIQEPETIVPYAYIYTISDGDIKEIIEKLDRDFEHFSYTTVREKEQELRENLNLNIVSLNILNTMSFVFTLLSIGSSIIMILIRRQREIAILKTLSIRNKVIQLALLREMEEILIGAIILSAGVGPVAANFVLKANGFSALTWDLQVAKIVGCGILLNIFLYSVFAYIIVSVIKKIDPLEVLKNNSETVWKEKKSIIVKAAFFLIIAFILYAAYLKNTAALLSSILLVLFILIMGLFILLAISVWNRLPVKKDINRYFKKSIRKGKGIFLISIVSFAMTIWFLFMGYTFAETVYDSYEKFSDQELEYNYMVFGDDTAQLEERLEDFDDTVQYTKMQKKSAFLALENGTYQAASLCYIPADSYGVLFHMKAGKAFGAGSSSDVLISDDMAEENKLEIGDSLCIQTESGEEKVTVKGIYISGGINKNYILTEEKMSDVQMDLFLVKTDQPHFEKELKNVTIVQVSTLALSVMNMFEKYLNMFQNLVFVSIFNSILFNCIIMCINSRMQEKPYAVLHAIGISKKELYRIEVKKYGLTVVFSFGIAVVLYWIISKLCIQLLFQIEIYVKPIAFSGPAAMALFLVGIIYIIPIYRIRRGIDYEILRIE